jgi:hypothetical protein
VSEAEIMALLAQVSTLVEQLKAIVPRQVDATVSLITSADQLSAAVAALTDAVSVLAHEVRMLRGGGQQ